MDIPDGDRRRKKKIETSENFLAITWNLNFPPEGRDPSPPSGLGVTFFRDFKLLFRGYSGLDSAAPWREWRRYSDRAPRSPPA
jgi:hypothetical protein